MFKFWLFTLCFHIFISSSNQVIIECDYSSYTYEVLGNIYRCNVKNNPNEVNPESSQVTSTFGVHHSGKTNDEVIGFHAVGKSFQFFPQGLDKNFKNIKSIYLFNCGLKEVHQADLKPFSSLIYLYLFGNKIEIIEPELFNYNTNLEYISIGDNKIIHIDANVFDGLKKLWHLHLNAVTCYDKYSCNYAETQQFIRELRLKCKNSELVGIYDKMKNLQNEAENLGYHEYNTKVVVLEKELSSSRFASNSFLKSKIENLKFKKASSITDDLSNLQSQNSKNSQTCTNCCQIDQISSLNVKISNMDKFLATLKPFQNEIESQLSGISSMITDQGSKLNEVQSSLENIEVHLKDFEVRVRENLEQIKKDLENTRHKMEVKFDEKIRGVEKRLEKKLVDVLVENFERILDEKLGNIIKKYQ